MHTQPANPPPASAELLHARHDPETRNGAAYSKASPDFSELIRNGTAVVLSVSPLTEDHVHLQSICEKTCWRICEAYTYQEALVRIAQEKPDVVLCEASLPDGNWKELLAELSGSLNPPHLIVTSRLADDHMWAEVLNLGAYDMLVKPFDAVEIYRVVGFACQRHQEQNNRTAKH